MTVKHNRAIAIVYNGNQLMYACQIRRTVFNKMPLDMLYVDMDIDEKSAQSIFDNVYKCCSQEAPPKKHALRCFFDPQWAMKKYYSNIDLARYSDIFVWHPGWPFYFFYKYQLYKHHKYIWHLLPEGAGVYTYTMPEVNIKKYGYKPLSCVIQFLDRRLFRYSLMVNDLFKDVYIIKPEYSITDNTIPKVSVPQYSLTDYRYINTINSIFFQNKPVFYDNKLIILDGAREGQRNRFYNVGKMDDIIYKIGRTLGRENVILKRKQGVDISQYSSRVLEVVTLYEDENIPWELVCLNDSIATSIVLGVNSSAIFLPYIMLGYEQEIYRIGCDIVGYKYFNKEAVTEDERYIDELMEKNRHYHVIELDSEIDSFINKCAIKLKLKVEK